jgi:hypothetical protein
MGTTLTTHLSLIMPDADEKIEEDLPTYAGWATQNANNMNTIDSLFRFTTATYTPTVTPIGGGTFAVGTGGSITGKYMRVGPAMIYGQVIINCGTTGFTAGTSDYRISVPLAFASALTTLQDTVPVGKGVYYDQSAVATCMALTSFYHVSSGTFTLRTPAGAAVGATSPVTVAQQDRIGFNFLYPTSVA